MVPCIRYSLPCSEMFKIVNEINNRHPMRNSYNSINEKINHQRIIDS